MKKVKLIFETEVPDDWNKDKIKDFMIYSLYTEIDTLHSSFINSKIHRFNAIKAKLKIKEL